MIDLQNIEDKELFQLTINTSTEIKRRILNLLKSSPYTCFYFNLEEDTICTTVVNVYNNFSEEIKIINVSAVGYSTEQGTGKPEDFIYVLDEKSHLYSGEELDDLWDVYSELKKNL